MDPKSALLSRIAAASGALAAGLLAEHARRVPPPPAPPLTRLESGDPTAIYDLDLAVIKRLVKTSPRHRELLRQACITEIKRELARANAPNH
jgi:hypothetical protein